MQAPPAPGAARLPQPPALPPGARLLNRYVIEGYIGGGGFGHIYRAHDTWFDCPRAIKEAFYRDPGTQQQFQLEAEFLVIARHPNLVRGYTVFAFAGKLYLVMDYVDGKTLEDLAIERIRRTGRTPTEAQVLDWILPICGAVETLHSLPRPIIHRDIKPANIKLSDTLDIPILIDLGLAKLFAHGQRTLGAALAFTPGYAPPEQYQATGATDQRTDVYGMGATLYFLLTGYQPTEAPARLTAHALPTPCALNPALSQTVEAIVLKAMELDPTRRYQSMRDLDEALRACRAALAPAQMTVAPDASAGLSRPAPASDDTAARRGIHAATDVAPRPAANPLYDTGATDALRPQDNATNPIVETPAAPPTPNMPPPVVFAGAQLTPDANKLQWDGGAAPHNPLQPAPLTPKGYAPQNAVPAPAAHAPYRERQPQVAPPSGWRRWASGAARQNTATEESLAARPPTRREAYGSIAAFIAIVCLTLSFLAPFARPTLLFLAPALLLATWSITLLREIRDTAREFRWMAISALVLGGVWLVIWLLLWLH